MSSRNSSAHSISGAGSSGGSSTIVSHGIFRAHKSENHQGERTERQSHGGSRTTIYNHHARGYEEAAPTPGYGQSTTYPRKH
ncbi:hypothetical protein GGR58DRAFT_407294 [Xylaria digitata]|nr:hypothetical protein GGR58DRAFT_407294 [Xylaria digitata]